MAAVKQTEENNCWSRPLSIWLKQTMMQTSTLHATRCGQSFPKPSGGDIRRSRATTSRCFMRPLANTRNNMASSSLCCQIHWVLWRQGA